MTSGPVLVVCGATGAVGRTILEMLATRAAIWSQVRVGAPSRHVGELVNGYGRELRLCEVDEALFEGADVALFAMPPEAAREAAALAQAHGVPVVDCSPAFRAAADVPLVVPEINPGKIERSAHGIIASPSASSTALAIALAPLHAHWGLTSVVVTAMQAVSGLGDAGTRQLIAEVRAMSGSDVGKRPGDLRRVVADVAGNSPFPAPVAGNVVPVTSELDSMGWSVQEARMRNEVRKVLDLPSLKVAATTVWVSVLRSHSLSVHATFASAMTADEARQALIEGQNSVVVLDDPENQDWPSPADTAGSEPTFVGRIRVSPDFPNSLEMFVCADNLRKGAALNLIQIAEAVAGHPDQMLIR